MNDEMYGSAEAYLRGIEQGDEVLVVHHWDMDGSAAAAITSRVLAASRGRPADTVVIPRGRKHTVGERAERIIQTRGVDHLVVLDMHVPDDRLAELADYGLDVLVVDHHTFDAVPEHAVFVNPRVDDPEAYVPAARLCNDIAARFDLDLDWIAGLGIIQDFAVAGNEALFERLREEFPHYFPDELTQHSLAKECRYGEYAAVLNIKAYRDSDRCARLAHDALVNAESLRHLEMQPGYATLKTYYQQMHREIQRVTERFEEEQEVFDDVDLALFRFDSDFHINSSIATQVSMSDEDRIYLIANTHRGTANVSARCQAGRVDLGALLREALPDDVEGEAGGHRKAAGASLPADRLDAFRDDVVALLREQGE